MPFLSPNCMVHDCLFKYIAAGRHIWRSFPYPPPGDAAGSLQKGPNSGNAQCNVMSMWSLRWHFTNKSVAGAPYSIKGYSYSLSHSQTLWWRVRWLKQCRLKVAAELRQDSIHQSKYSKPHENCFHNLYNALSHILLPSEDMEQSCVKFKKNKLNTIDRFDKILPSPKKIAG